MGQFAFFPQVQHYLILVWIQLLTAVLASLDCSSQLIGVISAASDPDLVYKLHVAEYISLPWRLGLRLHNIMRMIEI